jgi:hypothetical protein
MLGMENSEKSKDCFFVKKQQKTFFHWARAGRPARATCTKVFWFFFSKKNGLLMP